MSLPEITALKNEVELKRKIVQLFMIGIPDNSFPDEYAALCEKYYIGNFTLNEKVAKIMQSSLIPFC